MTAPAKNGELPSRSRRAVWGSRAWRWTRLPLFSYVGVVVLMALLEERLVFGPQRHPNGFWRPAGLDFEDVDFEAADGVKLHGWYVPHPNPRAYVLFAHGNGGNVTYWAEEYATLHKLGVAVFAFDYRGYGRSLGVPNEAGVLTDARAARAWLAKRAGIDQKDVVVMGLSLGGGVAVDLAAADGARGLVLLNTFNSLPDAAAVHYPWVPVRWLMRSRFDSAAKIARYHGPLLQTHGDRDDIVPLALGKQLFAAANEPKRFVLVPRGGHNDPLTPAFVTALDEFLEHLPPMSQGSSAQAAP
ncbi:MAG: alpha/beta hydrolase [Pirellulales bacterium]